MFQKLFCFFISSTICVFMITGCSGKTNGSADASEQSGGTMEADTFIADEALDEYLNADVYQRVLSEPIGADPPQLAFFNKDVVCILNYNGLLIFDSKTGKMKDAIDIQKMGFGATQGDSAMVVRGNDDFVTITTMDSPKEYVYKIASSQLGELSKTDDITYTEMKIPEQRVIGRLDLAGFGDSSETSILESKDGVVACHIPLDNLSQMKFRIYDADYKTIDEFSTTK